MSMGDHVIQVIRRADLIENILNQVIQKYCRPREEAFRFFWSVVLDSSIMSFGSKVKVAMAISQQVGAKLNKDSLHRVMLLRNAFAHHDIKAHPVVSVSKSPENDELHYMLHTLTPTGRIRRQRRAEALNEFSESFEQARKSLENLLESVNINVHNQEERAP